MDDECKLRIFYEKCIATEVAADAPGEEWKGNVKNGRVMWFESVVGMTNKVSP